MVLEGSMIDKKHFDISGKPPVRELQYRSLMFCKATPSESENQSLGKLELFIVGRTGSDPSSHKHMDTAGMYEVWKWYRIEAEHIQQTQVNLWVNLIPGTYFYSTDICSSTHSYSLLRGPHDHLTQNEKFKPGSQMS